MKNIRRSIFLLPLILAAVSCVREINVPGGMETGADEGRIRFMIKTPAPSRPGTRAVDTGFENGINNMVVAVLREDGNGVPVVNEIIPVNNFQKTSATTGSFTLALPASKDPVKLIIFANCNIGQTAMQQFGGMTDAGLREALYAQYDGEDFDMTMYGEATVDGIDPENVKSIGVTMLRSVARVDLQLNLVADSEDFVPTEVWIYRANEYFQIMPDAGVLDLDKMMVTGPSPVESNDGKITFAASVEQTLDADGRFATVYLAESSPETDAARQVDQSTCIVVGGSFNGGATTYYRLDFNSKQPGHPFGQILRNYRYVFNVSKVTAPGHTDRDVAATTVSSAIVVNVSPWQDNVSDIFFTDPEGFFSIGGGNRLDFRYAAGETKTFTVRSSVPFAIKFPDPGLPVNGFEVSPSNPGAAIPDMTSDWFRVTTSVSASDPAGTPPWVEYTFTVTSLQNNAFSEHGEQLTFRVGNGQVAIDNVQAPRPSKIIRIYSVGTDTGSFGDSSGGSGAAATGNNGTVMPLKTMLADAPQFNAGGAFDGLADIQFSNDPTGMQFTTANNGTVLGQILAGVDILVLSYGVSVDASNADAITGWLAADPARVLFVCSDVINRDANNEVFLKALSQYCNYSGGAGAMSWEGQDGLLESITDLLPVIGSLLLDPLLNDLLSNINGTFPASMPTGTAPFLNGKFGAVNLNANFECTDAEFGLIDTGNQTLPGQVAPLVFTYRSGIEMRGLGSLAVPVLTGAQRQDEMLMGADVAHRIVYVGESNLFTDMKYTSGQTIGASSDPLTLLMANTWAWAIETVLK